MAADVRGSPRRSPRPCNRFRLLSVNRSSHGLACRHGIERTCRFSTLMAHAAILTDGFPVFLIKVARAFFSFQWQIRQPHGCVVVDPWLR